GRLELYLSRLRRLRCCRGITVGAGRFRLVLPTSGSGTLAADEDGFRQMPGDELDAADAVVVAGNGEVHQVRVAVRIDQGNRGDAQGPRLLDAVLFLVRVEHHQALRHAVKNPQPVQVAIHLAMLAVEG